jgi:hypothetical protein
MDVPYEMLYNVMLECVAWLRENVLAEVPVAVESEREDDGRRMGLSFSPSTEMRWELSWRKRAG